MVDIRMGDIRVGDIRVGWLLGLVFTAIPVLFFVYRRYITKNKIEVDAVVVDIAKDTRLDVSFNGFPVLRYTVAGKIYTTQYNGGSWKPYLKGAVVRIYCLKENPEKYIVPGDKTLLVMLWVFLIMGLATLGFAAFLTITGE